VVICRKFILVFLTQSLVLALIGCSQSSAPNGINYSKLATEIPVTRAQCNPFGNPQRPRNDTLGDVELGITTCLGGGARLPDWTDPNGTTRRACIFDPGTATPERKLPLVVYLQASGFPADLQIPLTTMTQHLSTANVSDDPQRPGFILLAPIGRITDHFYPAPNNTNTVGWDVWYRQFLPITRIVNGVEYPENPDFATIDHYIQDQIATGRVDTNRIYMLGWSNGSALSLLYGQNRSFVAAAALYSGPDPYDSLSDTCGQMPTTKSPKNDTELQVFNPSIPVYHIQNNCDTSATCPNGLALRDKLIKSGTAEIKHQIITGGLDRAATDQCIASCGTNPRGDENNLEAKTTGQANHLLWPLPWTDSFIEFMRTHPLEK